MATAAATPEPVVAEPRQPPRIRWYRSPVDRDALAALNQRSDLWGGLQTGGFLLLLAVNATLVFVSATRWPWYVTAALLFWHGTCWAFLINGFHELVHRSVFRTRWLNEVFVWVFGFLGWHNPHWFWASHTAHHKYTLHDPDDLEVVVPVKLTLGGFLARAFVDIHWIFHNLRGQVRRALGDSNPDRDRWTAQLFPSDDPAARRKLVNWARVLLVGHGLVATVSLAVGWWMVPVVITLAPAYGKWLHLLCNETQHAGLPGDTPDFRLCCRTVLLNPFVEFLYWHMNYHTEHHMYAAVPCYNLPKLHRAIAADLPPCSRGLIAVWRQIIPVLRRQRHDPEFSSVAPLPSHPS
jgi:fatty acid desaturase